MIPSLAADYPQVVFVKVDVDEADELSEEYQVITECCCNRAKPTIVPCKVTAMPTFVFMKNGEKIEEYTGTDLDHIRAIINKNK